MPYDYRKSGKGYEVYKKDTGEVVGHTTKENLKKYLAALYVHSKDKGKDSGRIVGR